MEVADKVENIYALPANHPRIGGKLWLRFNTRQINRVWDYHEAVKAYEMSGVQQPMLTELTRLGAGLGGLQKEEVTLLNR